MTIMIIGRGGHAKVVADACRLLGKAVTFVAPITAPQPDTIDESALLAAGPQPGMQIICGIGSVGSQTLRRDVLAKYQSFANHFANVVHPRANNGATKSGRGVFLAQGSEIVAGVVLGDHVIVNTGAIVDHDCNLGFATHVATGAVLCGDVRTGAHVHVGANATVLQGVTIADGCVIGAGSVVTKNIDDPNTVWVGAPAKRIKVISP